MTLKPNHKPMGIAEISIFMLGFFLGERKPPEQILKAKDHGKVTKAGKKHGHYSKLQSTITFFFTVSCFKVLSRIANRQEKQALQTMHAAERDK